MTRTLQTVAFAATAILSTSALATDGYFSHGYGTESKGRAGTGTAFSTEALSVATNPANVQRAGNRLDVGLAWFSPRREFTAGNPTGQNGQILLEPGTWESDAENFFIPHIAYTAALDASSSWGLALYGNGGMNTDYPAEPNPVREPSGQCPQNGTFCAGKTGVDLSQLFLVPSFAMKATPYLNLGVAPILAYQRFKATGLLAFGPAPDGSSPGFSSDPTALSNNDYDDAFGYGVRVGVQMTVNEGISLGASYQSRIYMTEFDKYKGLFAEQGDLDIPSSMNIGAAFVLARSTTLAVDVFHTRYSEVKSIGNGITQAAFGTNNGPGFGWDDITVVKLGIEHQLTPMVVLRGGYSNGDSPIDSEDVTLNVLAPGVVTEHYTLGSTISLNKKQALNLAFMYATSDGEKGANAFFPDQQVALDMDQFEFELSFSQTF